MKKIVVLTGAGISAESGIKTFRDSNGLWENYNVSEVATPEGFYRNPQLVTEFYNTRRKELLNVEPNKAHYLVAELEKDFDVTVVTQNIDNLHERAGSHKIIHLHGELTKVCSSLDPYNPQFIKELSPEEYEVSYKDKADDGSPIRPFVVWFGEAVPKIEEAIDVVKETDILIIIGTSLQVYPAAGLINYVSSKTPIYIIDPKDVPSAPGYNIKHLKTVASKGMEEIMDILKQYK